MGSDMCKSYLFIISIVTALSISSPAHAKVYKWVDDQGVTHYGEVIPTEYANKTRDTINKSGMLDKRPEKQDAETIKAKEEAEKKRKIERQAEIEQQRRDNAMLDTYSNVAEIDLARDRSLVLINARVESNKMLLKSSQGTLDDLKLEVDVRNKEGKKIPASLANDIAQTEARVARYQAELSKSEEEVTTVKTRFEKEKELYRRLKAGMAK